MKKIMSVAALMVALALPAVALAGEDAPKVTSDTKPAMTQQSPDATKAAPMKAKEVAKKTAKTAKIDKKADKADKAKLTDKAPVAPVATTAPAK